MTCSRRVFLGSVATAGAALAGAPLRARSAEPVPIDVAYAGSMTSVMEGPIKAAALRRFGLAIQGRAQGASGLAAQIVGGTISPDVFVAVTPSPMQRCIDAGKAQRALPIARTEMVLAYAPQSRFAPAFRAAANARAATPWYEVLQQDGLRFGRTDPATDPLGRNAIYVLELAERFYRAPGLRARILGPDVNPAQIFTEPTIEARLQSGQIDAALTYKIQPAAFGLPYLALPPEIDLGVAARADAYADAALTLGEKTMHPEPLTYYAAVLAGSARSTEATTFVDWLGGAEAQAILARFGYDDAAAAAALHA